MRDARKYRHRISVYAHTETADGVGGSTLSGSLLGKAWADIKTIAENKLTEYGLNEVRGGIRVFVRKHGTIDWSREDIYINYKGLDWEINAVTEVNLWDVEYELIASHG